MKKLFTFTLVVMFLLINVAVYGSGWIGDSNAASTDTTITKKQTKSETTKNEKKDDPTVYVTKNGKKYHKKNCSIVKEGKTGIKLSEAIKRGLDPCAVCKPPTKPSTKDK